jgi:hypothetical protein
MRLGRQELDAWSTQGLVDGNHTPGCGLGRGITSPPDYAFGVKLPRGFYSTSLIRWLRQDGFIVTMNWDYGSRAAALWLDR